MVIKSQEPQVDSGMKCGLLILYNSGVSVLPCSMIGKVITVFNGTRASAVWPSNSRVRALSIGIKSSPVVRPSWNV